MDSLTATHEAGHAVAGLAVGEFPELASIRAEGHSLGHVQSLHVEAETIARAALLGRRPQDREIVTSHLISSAAGPVAQAMISGGLARSFPFPWELHGGLRDQEIIETLRGHAGNLLEVNEDDVVQRAIDLLEEPRIWQAVERVAHSLQRWGELDYNEIQSAVLGYPI
jgi:hypothetical protein